MVASDWSESGARLGGSKVHPSAKWNAKDLEASVPWLLQVRRACRRVTNSDFLGSAQPRLAEFEAMQNGPSTRGQSAQNPQVAFEAATEIWNSYDVKVYDVIMDHLDLGITDLNHVSVTFEPEQKGNELFAWCLAKAKPTATSTQKHYTQEVSRMEPIDTNATPDDVERTLDTLKFMWGMITHLEQKDPAQLISKANSLLVNHPISSYIGTLQALHDCGIQKWTSFDQYKQMIMEHVKTNAVERRSAGHAAFAFTQQRQQQQQASPGTAQRINKCSLCDAYGCEGSNACEVFGRPRKQPQGQRRKYISLLKKYAKLEGLTSLKGVQIPRDWVVKNKDKLDALRKKEEEAKKARQGAPQTNLVLGQQDDVDDDDMDDAFWDDIESTNESLFMLAHDESNSVVDQTERAALCQFPGCHRAVFVDPDTKQGYAYCGITHGKAHMRMLEEVTNELWPEDEAKPATSAPAAYETVASVPSPQPPPVVMSAPGSRPGVLPVLPDKTMNAMAAPFSTSIPVNLQTVSEEAMTVYDVKPKPNIVPVSNAILSAISAANDTSKRLSFASSGSVTPMSIVATPTTAPTRINSVGVTPLDELQRHRRSTMTSASVDYEQLARQQAERIATMQLTLDDASSSLSVAGTHIASQNTRIEQLC